MEQTALKHFLIPWLIPWLTLLLCGLPPGPESLLGPPAPYTPLPGDGMLPATLQTPPGAGPAVIYREGSCGSRRPGSGEEPRHGASGSQAEGTVSGKSHPAWPVPGRRGWGCPRGKSGSRGQLPARPVPPPPPRSRPCPCVFPLAPHSPHGGHEAGGSGERLGGGPVRRGDGPRDAAPGDPPTRATPRGVLHTQAPTQTLLRGLPGPRAVLCVAHRTPMRAVPVGCGAPPVPRA